MPTDPWEPMDTVTNDEPDATTPPHPDNDDLDRVAQEVRAVTTANVPVTGLERSPEQNEAAKAIAVAARIEAERRAEAETEAVEQVEPPHEARSIEALATITNQVAAGQMPVSLRIPNRVVAAIVAQHYDPHAEVGELELLDIVADHIHAHLPATIGPTPIDQWLQRIEEMQAAQLGRIDRHKLDAWPPAPEVRS